MHHMTCEPERRPYLQSGGAAYNTYSGAVRCRNKKCQFLDHLQLAPSARNGPTLFLSWLKNGKVVGVADEHTPEEIHRQESIELAGAGIPPGLKPRPFLALDN